MSHGPPDPVRAVLEQVLTALGKDPGFGADATNEHLLEQITRAAEAGRRSASGAYGDLNRVIGFAQDLLAKSAVIEGDRKGVYWGIGHQILAQIWSIPAEPYRPSTLCRNPW